MSNFTKITSNAKYPSHVVRKAARSMLLNAARCVTTLNDEAISILQEAQYQVAASTALQPEESKEDEMSNKVLNVAYGMNSGEITGMTTRQLVAAFFMADTNMPSIKPDCRKDIRHNMALIADEMSERLDRTIGKRNQIRIEVQLMCMKVIVKMLYDGTIEVK